MSMCFTGEKHELCNSSQIGLMVARTFGLQLL